jgi:antitoxin (DNA-binding transcriptional repressor) of toxin-antitoxin stability system
MMKAVPIAEIEADLSGYLEQCQAEGPIAITRGGKTIALLLAPRDEEDAERLALGYSPRFQALLDKSRESIKAGKGLSRDAFWQAVEERGHEKERTSEG